MHPQCPGCQDIYSNRMPPQTPPCDICKVDLIETNIDPALVYEMCQNQIIAVGMDGTAIDISIPAVKIAMDLYKVENQLSCLNKVRSLFFYLENQRRKNAN